MLRELLPDVQLAVKGVAATTPTPRTPKQVTFPPHCHHPPPWDLLRA